MNVKNTTKRRSKSISKAIMSMLLILGFVPIVIMAINSYIINIDTLRERNDIAKQGAVATIQKARTDLSKTTNDKLTEVSRQPIFENDFDFKQIRHDLQLTISGDYSYTNVIFINQNGKFTSAKSIKDTADLRTKDWYKGAIQKEGQIYWTTPHYLEATGNG